MFGMHSKAPPASDTEAWTPDQRPVTERIAAQAELMRPVSTSVCGPLPLFSWRLAARCVKLAAHEFEFTISCLPHRTATPA